MFWKFNLLPSQVDSLLEKEDVTLDEILDEDDVLQECKAQNSKLIDFLVIPEHLEQLVTLSISPPPNDVAEKLQYKYPYIACELLTSDVPRITDTLVSNKELLDKIYAFIETDAELNSLLASFFSKIMGLLTSRKSETLLEYLQDKEDFVGLLLRHISTSAVMDVLLRLVTCIESTECRTQCIEWLNNQRLVQRLVELISTTHSEDKHCNAAQSLCDIVRMSREYLSQQQDKAAVDPLLSTIESEATICELLSNILSNDRNESVLGNGLSVIQIILELRKPPSMEETSSLDGNQKEPDRQGIDNTTNVLAKRLNDINLLLLEPPKQHFSRMQTTVGALEPPLGNCRLQITRLITTLVITNSTTVNEQLAATGCINTVLDLFLNYPWNNFLHTQVEQCIGAILNNVENEAKESRCLLAQLFKECKIIQRILDAWEDNDQSQIVSGGRRLGYMGHLFRMASHIVAGCEQGQNGERLKELIQELDDETREKWQTFVSGAFAENKKQNTVDFRDCFPTHSGSEDDEPELRHIAFPQDNAMQEAFSDYTAQHMTSNFIDQFGFSEDTLGEQEDPIDTNKITSVKFENSSNTRSLFEQACSERIQQFDDINDEDEQVDKWQEKEITFDPRSSLPDGASGAVGSDSNSSSDSEEDLDSIPKIRQIVPTSSTPRTADSSSSTAMKAENMDIDSTEWPGSLDDVAMENVPVAMDTGTSWASSGSAAQPSGSSEVPSASSDNWANFESAKSEEASGSKDNWADFTNIGTVDSNTEQLCSTTDASTPTAMDTAESSARANAYKAEVTMDSCEPDSSRESLDSRPTPVVDSPSSVTSSSDTSQVPNTTTSTTSPGITQGTVSGASATSDTSSTTVSTSDVSSAGITPHTVTTTSAAACTDGTGGPKATSTSNLPDAVDSTSDSTMSLAGSAPMFRNPPPLDFSDDLDDDLSSGPTSSEPCITAFSPGSLVPKLELQDLDNQDNDLDNNFDFLATSGLMRSRDGGEGRLQLEELSSSTTEATSPRPSPVSASDSPSAGVSSTSVSSEATPTTNSATPTTSSATPTTNSATPPEAKPDEGASAQLTAIEEARAKAKAAMESFTSMTVPSSSSSNENGPV